MTHFPCDQTLPGVSTELTAASDQSGDFLSFADVTHRPNGPLKKSLADRLGRTVFEEQSLPPQRECQNKADPFTLNVAEDRHCFTAHHSLFSSPLKQAFFVSVAASKPLKDRLGLFAASAINANGTNCNIFYCAISNCNVTN